MLWLAVSASWANAQEAAPPAAAAPAVEEKPVVDPDASYAPPRLTPEAETLWKRSPTGLTAFQKAQKSPAPTIAETKVLVEGANLYVDKITMQSTRKDLWKLAVDPAKRTVDLATPSARSILLSAITKRVAELLNENPRHQPEVELNLILLLSHLNADPGSVTPPKPAVPYIPAHTTLIAYVKDPTRLVQCRIHASIALGRIGRDSVLGVKEGDLSVVQRATISTALTETLAGSELKGNKVGQVWLRWRLLEALGNCGVAVEPTGATTYIDAAMRIAVDPAENLRVRAAALRAVSQMNLPAGTNVLLITSELVKVVEQVAKDFNASVQAKQPVNPDTSWAVMECYLAFQPATAAQAGPPRLWGMLNQPNRAGLGGHKALVAGAYAVCVPIINHVINNTKNPLVIPNAQVVSLTAWVTANPPADRKPTLASPELQ